jgi:hypothetical protein
VLRDHRGPVERARHARDARRAQRTPPRAVGDEPRRGARQRAVVGGEHAVHAVVDEPGDPVAGAAEHREPGRARLERGDAERLAHRGEHERVGVVVEGAQRRARQPAGDDERVAEPARARGPQERAARRAVARRDEAHRTPAAPPAPPRPAGRRAPAGASWR